MTDYAIEIDNLTCKYEDYTAVHSLSLQVPTGKLFCLLGANGAGKTTIIKALMNQHKPAGGKIKVLGKDPRESVMDPEVGYVVQNKDFYEWMTVEEKVEFFSTVYDRCEEGKNDWEKNRGKWDQTKADALLGSLLYPFPVKKKQKIKDLSEGLYAQLALILALGHNPRLLVLDDPFSRLDDFLAESFMHMIREFISDDIEDEESDSDEIKNRSTVFLASSRVDYSEESLNKMAEFAAILVDGRLSRDQIEVADLLARGRTLMDVFREDVQGRDRGRGS